MNWHSLPNQDGENSEQISVQEYINHEAWSEFLDNNFGVGAAISFAVGSDILLDHIKEDMIELASMPVGTHIGQLNMSWLNGSLPEQFQMQYNYEFLHRMKCTLHNMRIRAKIGLPMTPHSVMEELLLYLCCEESSALIELSGGICDMDIISCLYSNVHLDADHTYHFSHWENQQFYTE